MNDKFDFVVFGLGIIVGIFLAANKLSHRYNFVKKEVCVESKIVDIPEAVLYEYKAEGNNEVVQPYIVPAHTKSICTKYR